MAHTLPDMPVEIFHIIIDGLHENGKLHRDHLRNLRLACREIESKTRIRFGQGYFHTIVLDLLCIPNDFVRATNILQDKWFRECVKHIDLRVGHPSQTFREDRELIATLDRGLEGFFAHQFANVLTQTKNVKRISLVGSGVLLSATLALRIKVMNVCHNVAVQALRALSAQDGVHIEQLTLGHKDFASPPINAAMLQHLPSASTAFTDLVSLSVFMVVGAEHLGVPIPMNSPTAVELLANLLSLTPKLRNLYLTGGNSIHNICRGHFAATLLSPFSKQPRPLQRLHLTAISLTQVQLAEGLLRIGATLEELVLENVQIVLGTWQAVFRAVCQSRRLTLVQLDGLRQGFYCLIFESVTEQRPFTVERLSALTKEEEMQVEDAIMIESSAVTQDSISYRAKEKEMQVEDAIMIESSAVTQDSISYRAKEKEMREAIVNGWTWVFHDSTRGSRIALDAGEGDDIEMWLSMVGEQHRLL